MSFRTIVITKQAKLSYKNRFLYVKQANDENYVHLSEIDTIIVDSTAASISTYLLKEISKKKINIIFCDEKHNPFGELQSYYLGHNSPKKIMMQTKWTKKLKNEIWRYVVQNKIVNQAKVIKMIDSENYKLLMTYAKEVEDGDKTNREGHAAKVYFSTLFGLKFIRHNSDDINSALNYGYTLLLSTFNKEIVSQGYLTQLGIHHKNEFNEFNLSSDLMEPFRPIIDRFVLQNKPFKFNKDFKLELISLLDQKYKYEGKYYTLKDIIKLYTYNLFKSLEKKEKYNGFWIDEE